MRKIAMIKKTRGKFWCWWLTNLIWNNLLGTPRDLTSCRIDKERNCWDFKKLIVNECRNANKTWKENSECTVSKLILITKGHITQGYSL